MSKEFSAKRSAPSHRERPVFLFAYVGQDEHTAFCAERLEFNHAPIKRIAKPISYASYRKIRLRYFASTPQPDLDVRFGRANDLFKAHRLLPLNHRGKVFASGQNVDLTGKAL